MNSNMLTSPIFLVGVDRSGTTVFRLMLNHHPQLSFMYEIEFVHQLIKDDSPEWPDLNDYYEFLSTDLTFLRSSFTIDKSLTYPELVNSFLLQKQQRDNKPLVGASSHHYFDRLVRIWPKAKFIHIVRDPRDVAPSHIKMGWVGNVFFGASNWVEIEQLWDKLSAQLPLEQKMTIKYEDLIRDSDGVLTQVCDFIGIPFDTAMYDYAKHTTYDLPDPNLLEQWRKKLSNYEIQLIESRVGVMLKERGYQPSGLPPLKITFWLKKRLYIQNRWVKKLFRIRHYPLRLVLMEMLLKWVKIKSWQKHLRLKLNPWDEKYFK